MEGTVASMAASLLSAFAKAVTANVTCSRHVRSS